MTTKEQAKELVNEYYVVLMKKNYPNVAQMDAAKECALIAASTLLRNNSDMYTSEYWREVRQEIKNL